MLVEDDADDTTKFVLGLLEEKKKITKDEILAGKIIIPNVVFYQENDESLPNPFKMKNLLKKHRLEEIRAEKEKLEKNLQKTNEKISKIKKDQSTKAMLKKNNIKLSIDSPNKDLRISNQIQVTRMKGTIKPIVANYHRYEIKFQNQEVENELTNDAKDFVYRLKNLENIRKKEYEKIQKIRKEKEYRKMVDSLQSLEETYNRYKIERQRENSLVKSSKFSNRYAPFSGNRSNLTIRGLSGISKNNKSYLDQSALPLINVKKGGFTPSSTIKGSASMSGFYNQTSRTKINPQNELTQIYESTEEKKSPYYFNNPRYNKIIETRERFGNKIKDGTNIIKTTYNDNELSS